MISFLVDSFRNFASLACLALRIEEVFFKSVSGTMVYKLCEDQVTAFNGDQPPYEFNVSSGSVLVRAPLDETSKVIFEKLLMTFENEVQKNFLKSVLDQIDDAVVACDENGTLKFFNKKTKELHGLPEEAIPADQWADHYDIYTHDLKNHMLKEEIPLFRAYSGENVINAELMIARKGQRPVFILSNASPMYDSNGNKVGAIATMREETRMKQQLNTVESRLNAIFLQSPLSIQICSKDGRTLLVNPAWKNLWQIPEDVIQNFILKEYNMLQDPTLEARGVMEHIKHGFAGEVSRIPIISYDVKGLGIEGSTRSVEGWIYPLKDAQGEVQEIVLIHIDVTEKEQLHSELSRLYQNAQEAVRQRDEFISIASHELKTPITSMKLQLQILDKVIEKSNERPLDIALVKKVAEINNRQLNRITLLVEDMLDISRITSGKLAINPKENNVTALLVDVITRYKVQLEEEKIPLIVHCEENIIATCDAFRIEQVLTNLMTNAIRYGMKKPVTISCKKVHGEVIIQFRDQGMGIAEEDQARIFERFERAVSANDISGLGLGLFISRQIMELHHGTLTVESRPGEGSTFTARWAY